MWYLAQFFSAFIFKIGLKMDGDAEVERTTHLWAYLQIFFEQKTH